MHPYLKYYIIVAAGVAALSFLLGLIFGRRILGNGMVLGLFNSAALGALWPVTIAMLFFGKVYDLVKVLKKL